MNHTALLSVSARGRGIIILSVGLGGGGNHGKDPTYASKWISVPIFSQCKVLLVAFQKFDRYIQILLLLRCRVFSYILSAAPCSDKLFDLGEWCTILEVPTTMLTRWLVSVFVVWLKILLHSLSWAFNYHQHFVICNFWSFSTICNMVIKLEFISSECAGKQFPYIKVFMFLLFVITLKIVLSCEMILLFTISNVIIGELTPHWSVLSVMVKMCYS